MAKKKAVKLPIPKDAQEVNTYITAIAEATQRVQRLAARANKQITSINSELATELDPLEEEIAQHAAALFTYFEKNKDRLTDGGKTQSAVFATGIIGQRLSPPRTKFEDEDAIKAYVEKHRLTEF